MNNNDKENNMNENFPVGGELLDIPDAGVGTSSPDEVAELLEA